MTAPGTLGARHPEVDRVRRLLRRPGDRAVEQAFVIEGRNLVADALAAGAPVEAVYIDERAAELDDVRRAASEAGVPVRVLGHGVVARIADVVTSQPLLAVVGTLDQPLASVIAATFVMVCVDIQDPGNAGTILRSAEAAGAGAVVFCGASVDPYNPKAVRASAGSLFHVPVVRGGDPVAVLDQLGAAGLHRLGTSARGGTVLDACDLTVPVALVLGNEAHGLPPAVLDRLDATVTIPMTGRAESLNVGMAAAVVSFEVARQRRGQHG